MGIVLVRCGGRGLFARVDRSRLQGVPWSSANSLFPHHSPLPCPLQNSPFLTGCHLPAARCELILSSLSAKFFRQGFPEEEGCAQFPQKKGR